ncbi:MAG: carbonic anhydrase [Flavobacteriales bacterium]|nr:carbonic anhydrase [Flavobacteriales bacterium]
MTISKHIQEILTPDQVIELLKKGNERFVNDNLRNIKTHHVLEATKGGQNPMASVLACMDSRLPIERIFDKTIGELFSFRTPGNVVSEDTIGGMEYGAVVAGTKLIVVMGHTGCGAVSASISGTVLGNLTSALNKIKPAVNSAAEGFDIATLENVEYVNTVIDANAVNQIEIIRKESKILRELEQKGEVKIVAAMYDIATGIVSFR